jgi:hypothetical protein
MMSSRELARILNIPNVSKTVEDQTLVYAKHAGAARLLPAQSKALFEANRVKGLLAPMGVGHGKTLTLWLLPKALGVPKDRVVLVLLPARTIANFYAEREKFKNDYDFPENVVVMSYSKLSRPDASDYLELLKPAAILADEAHNLSSVKSVRTRRLLRYFEANESTIFCAMSGTLTKKKLGDFSHLSYLALRNYTPLPAEWPLLQSWSRCVNHEDLEYPSASDWRAIEPLMIRYSSVGSAVLTRAPVKKKTEIARKALAERIAVTPGVSATVSASCDASIFIELVQGLAIPESIQKAIENAKTHYELPNGDYIGSAAHVVEAVNQLTQGFFYFWDWPGEPDRAWLRARKEWQQAVDCLLSYGLPKFDSFFLVSSAVARGYALEKFGTTPARRRDIMAAMGAYQRWLPQSEKPDPPRGVVWLDHYLVDYLHETVEPKTLVWVCHNEMREALRAKGFEVVEAGREPSGSERTLVLSIASHGTGLNLQNWNKNFIVTPPPSGSAFEQLIGRTHRNGQRRDEVFFKVLCHEQRLAENYTRAKENAVYLKNLTGQQQKLLIATEVSEENENENEKKKTKKQKP